MTLWAIVPVKPLRRGKSRLSGILTEDERADLNRTLLQHTLETLTNLKEVEEVLVEKFADGRHRARRIPQRIRSASLAV